MRQISHHIYKSTLPIATPYNTQTNFCLQVPQNRPNPLNLNIVTSVIGPVYTHTYAPLHLTFFFPFLLKICSGIPDIFREALSQNSGFSWSGRLFNFSSSGYHNTTRIIHFCFEKKQQRTIHTNNYLFYRSHTQTEMTSTTISQWPRYKNWRSARWYTLPRTLPWWKVRMSNKQLLLLFQLDALQIKRCQVHPPVQP